MTNFWKRNRALIITVVIVLAAVGIVVQDMEPKVWMSILLSGVTLAALYFLIASGLSLIFGLMDVLNFAHGAIFVLGAYVGLSTFMNPRLLFNTIPFFLSIVSGALIAQYFGVYMWRRVKTKGARQVLWWVMLILAVGIIALGGGNHCLQPAPISDSCH